MYRDHKVRHLKFFDENPGKSLGLYILLLLSIITMKKHATSSENEMTQVCTEYIWTIKSNASTLSDFLSLDSCYGTGGTHLVKKKKLYIYHSNILNSLISLIIQIS